MVSKQVHENANGNSEIEYSQIQVAARIEEIALGQTAIKKIRFFYYENGFRDYFPAYLVIVM